MHLVFFPEANFGDALNCWLWPRLWPEVWTPEDGVALVGIGTLLNDRLAAQLRDYPTKVVFGTGYGYGDGGPVEWDEHWHIYGLRGPLTAAALGVHASLAMTDGAALVGRWRDRLRSELTQIPEPSYRYSYMPHYIQAGDPWQRACEQLGWGYIDPRWPVERVLGALLASQTVVAEAMHGAIVADALRIPWLAVTSDARILSLKWRDWCGSLGLRYDPYPVDPQQPLAEQLAAARLAIAPQLSSDRLFWTAVGRLEAALAQLQGDYAAGRFWQRRSG